MCHVRKRQIAIQTAGWPWPPGVPDFKTSFTCSVILGYFPESFNVLWPQQWNINYCENLGALACEVSILSSVMGCLCSGPKNRLQTRKRSLPCQGDRAEQEGKMWGWLGTASPMVWQAGKHLPWETEPPKNTWITLVAPGAAQEMGDGHDSLSWSVPSCPGSAVSGPFAMRISGTALTSPARTPADTKDLAAVGSAACCGCFNLKGDMYPFVSASTSSPCM